MNPRSLFVGRFALLGGVLTVGLCLLLVAGCKRGAKNTEPARDESAGVKPAPQPAPAPVNEPTPGGASGKQPPNITPPKDGWNPPVPGVQLPGANVPPGPGPNPTPGPVPPPGPLPAPGIPNPLGTGVIQTNPAPPLVPVAGQPPKDKKETDKKDGDKKESDKKDKPPEIKWPEDINGKKITDVMKDLEDPDPVIREFAARTLPLFGPPAQEDKVSALLIKRMQAANERDPGVRIAVFNAIGQIQFKNEIHNKEALRLLADAVDLSGPGGLIRLNAVQTIAMFGPKGSPAITKLTGQAITDPAYETRRNIANALGRVGFDETTGPNMKALTALADILAKDVSASVRMEALQSLMLLGPPWAAAKKAGMMGPPPINVKDAEIIVKYMKHRVGDPKAKPPLPATEKDKQVEIWARLVLMRFDPKEINDDNLDAFAKFLTTPDVGVKAQALQAIGIIGEMAGKKVDDVVRVMEDKGAPLQLTLASIQTLAAMGAGAKPALPSMKKMRDEKKKPLDEKMAEIKKQEAAMKGVDPQLAGEAIALDGLVKALEAAIKHIDEAKPTSPAVGSSGKDDPKKP